MMFNLFVSEGIDTFGVEFRFNLPFERSFLTPLFATLVAYPPARAPAVTVVVVVCSRPHRRYDPPTPTIAQKFPNSFNRNAAASLPSTGMLQLR